MGLDLRRVGAQHAVGVVDGQRALVLPLQDADGRNGVAHGKFVGRWQRGVRERGDVVSAVAHCERCKTELRDPMVGVRSEELLQSGERLLVVAIFEVLRLELKQWPVPKAAFVKGLARVLG